MRILESTCATFLILLVCAPSARTQRVVFDASKEVKGDGAFHPVWDPVGPRLISYRDVSRPDAPAVEESWADGKKLSFYPVRDLGANYIDVWSVAGSPDGGVAIAAILGFAARANRPIPVKSVILTYDGTGTLRNVWNVQPYHPHALAVDANGEVFALGHADLQNKPYPLLIKYSALGEDQGEYLSSNLFSDGDKVIDEDLQNGESRIFIRDNLLFTWIAATEELFTFSVDGAALARTSLSPALTTMADLSSSARVSIFELQPDRQRGIVAQVQLWPRDGSPSQVALVKIAPNGTFEKRIEEPSAAHSRRFLGLTSDDKPLFLERFGRSAVAVNVGQ